jgi:inosine-uridine nucleoside N-ribohydrolase
VYEILTANLDFVDGGGFQFWDSLTAASFTDQSIVTSEELKLMVMEEEGPENGRTKQDTNGAKIKVAVSADQNKFEQLFLTILNWAD